MTTDELRAEWTRAERELDQATHPAEVPDLTERAEQLFDEYMRAKVAESKVRRGSPSD